MKLIQIKYFPGPIHYIFMHHVIGHIIFVDSHGKVFWIKAELGVLRNVCWLSIGKFNFCCLSWYPQTSNENMKILQTSTNKRRVFDHFWFSTCYQKWYYQNIRVFPSPTFHSALLNLSTSISFRYEISVVNMFHTNVLSFPNKKKIIK